MLIKVTSVAFLALETAPKKALFLFVLKKQKKTYVYITLFIMEHYYHITYSSKSGNNNLQHLFLSPDNLLKNVKSLLKFPSKDSALLLK